MADKTTRVVKKSEESCYGCRDSKLVGVMAENTRGTKKITDYLFCVRFQVRIKNPFKPCEERRGY